MEGLRQKGWMPVLGRREAVMAAEVLSQELLQVYANQQVPESRDFFAQVGLSKERIHQSSGALFRILVIAAYDRRPFTGAAGGYEYIWGANSVSSSLSGCLEEAGLLDLNRVRTMTPESLDAQLSQLKYGGRSLRSAEDTVQYAKSIVDAARVAEGLHGSVVSARTGADVVAIYKGILEIHGIGTTIASKLIKYLFREIGVGNVGKSDFPLQTVWPIMDEYHNQEATLLIGARLGHDVVPLTMGLLLKQGDPCAIDALFYIHRNRRQWLEEYVHDAAFWRRGGTPAPRPTPPGEGKNPEKAQRLLSIIKEVCNDMDGLTDRELRKYGKTLSGAKRSAVVLLGPMTEHASRGDVNGMYSYYMNCLASSNGQEWDWVLGEIGRKSLKSERARFESIYHE